MSAPFEITLDEVDGLTPLQLAHDALFSLAIPMPSIGRTNNPIDIASDYAWALFSAELLHPHVISLSRRPARVGHSHYEYLLFKPRDAAHCLEALRQIRVLFDEDQPPESEVIRLECLEYEDALIGSPKVCLPDLGDSFLANFVHGAEATFEPDHLEELRRSHPTWRHYYWRSFLSPTVGADLYASSDAWILPRNFDLTRVLAYLGWDSTMAAPEFSRTTPVRLDSSRWILVNDSSCVNVPADELEAAFSCWQKELRSESTNSAAEPMEPFSSRYPKGEWSLTDDGSILSVRIDDVQLLTFLEPSSKVRREELLTELARLENTQALISVHCGVPQDPLDWKLLDPEAFEELCYDVLLRCDRYDPKRMRKLGKARSRDGGRDIEAWTMPRPGKPAQKWIYQCKFSSSSTGSLPASRVAVSDIVDQFDADGFGVLTNLVIDATLYDRLDAIARTRAKRGRELQVDTWSKYELERFLHPKRDLMKRYFRSS